MNTLKDNIDQIQATVEKISQIQTSNLKLEQQIETHFYQYMEAKINPAMLAIDQKISHIMDIMEHPNGSEISTIDMAEKVAEIEQQVYSDSMGMLTDDVGNIKKMLLAIQKKLNEK